MVLTPSLPSPLLLPQPRVHSHLLSTASGHQLSIDFLGKMGESLFCIPALGKKGLDTYFQGTDLPLGKLLPIPRS